MATEQNTNIICNKFKEGVCPNSDGCEHAYVHKYISKEGVECVSPFCYGYEDCKCIPITYAEAVALRLLTGKKVFQNEQT